MAVTSLTDAELQALVQDHGGAPFQARQLAHWIYRHGAASFEECRNLPRPLLNNLSSSTTVLSSAIAQTDHSDDGTDKYLVRLSDGESVECVAIPENGRLTVCISTQVGCPVGCVFCASGLDGVRRNLTSAEIVEQVLHVRKHVGQEQKLTNVVVMGLGEPLLNLQALLPALERLHDSDGINLGARRITVSTSGYPEHIARLAEAAHPYQLAVSLHAADDALRRRLVPTAQATVRDIVAAAAHYGRIRGREVTFEVVLLADVNDRPRDATLLARCLEDVRATVNLIPWNPVERIPDLRRPSRHQVDAFAESLREKGLKVTVRRQRGADRSAACGQLRLHSAS